MALHAISVASGGSLNFNNGYRGLQISSHGFLSISREFNLIRFDQPTWCRAVGLIRAIDCGTGTQIKLEWGHAISSDIERTLVFNIYYSEKRIDVFREGPKFITDKMNVVINGLTPGKMLFFGVRATDYPPAFTITDQIQAGQDLYLPPTDKGNEECNFNIDAVVPYFSQKNEPAGGRITPLSSAVDSTDGQDGQINFTGYDFCGWHAQQFGPYYTGKCIGSYAGGEQRRILPDGSAVSIRGLDLGERNSQREELLLQQTGEPIVLLRRKWEGHRCSCQTSRRESPKQRCKDCFGTGYVGGYNQFINPRTDDGRLLIRVSPTAVDLDKKDTGGLMQNHEPDAWTLSSPKLRDRDVIIRFDPVTNKETWRYEILRVTQNRAILGNVYGAQKFDIKRQDKTDPIYEVPYLL